MAERLELKSYTTGLYSQFEDIVNRILSDLDHKIKIMDPLKHSGQKPMDTLVGQMTTLRARESAVRLFLESHKHALKIVRDLIRAPRSKKDIDVIWESIGPKIDPYFTKIEHASEVLRKILASQQQQQQQKTQVSARIQRYLDRLEQVQKTLGSVTRFQQTLAGKLYTLLMNDLKGRVIAEKTKELLWKLHGKIADTTMILLPKMYGDDPNYLFDKTAQYATKAKQHVKRKATSVGNALIDYATGVKRKAGQMTSHAGSAIGRVATGAKKRLVQDVPASARKLSKRALGVLFGTPQQNAQAQARILDVALTRLPSDHPVAKKIKRKRETETLSSFFERVNQQNARARAGALLQGAEERQRIKKRMKTLIQALQEHRPAP